MNSQELREHVRRLNQQEQVEKELRRQKALNNIKRLRKIQEETQRARNAFYT